jgi:hypothetical protein
LKRQWCTSKEMQLNASNTKLSTKKACLCLGDVN